jgi:hypothetical protein
MSLIIAHLGQQAAHLVTDTAVLATTGEIAGFASKVYTVPHANMAIAVRGHIFALPIAAVHLQRAGSTFDEIQASAERVLRPVFSQLNPDLINAVENAGASHDVEITVAGISETRGPIAYQICSVPNHGVGWGIEEIEGHDEMFGPFDTPEIVAEFERRAAETPAGRFGQLEWLTDLARQLQAPVFGRGDAVVQVGGKAVLTKISNGGIETRILRIWPDRIGERIAA